MKDHRTITEQLLRGRDEYLKNKKSTVKKIITVAVIAFALLALAAASIPLFSLIKRPAADPGADPGTDATDPPDNNGEYDDGYDYTYTLGKASPVENLDASAFLGSGKTWQVVYGAGATGGFAPEALYAYDSFYTLEGAIAENDEPVWFRGKYALYVGCASDGMPGSTFVPVNLPCVFGCFRDKVLALEFSESADGGGSSFCTEFRLKTKDGGSTDYRVYTDGSVARGESEYSTEKLSADVVAYVFAARLTYRFMLVNTVNYSTSLQNAVEVQYGENRIILDPEASLSFLRMISDTDSEIMIGCSLGCTGISTAAEKDFGEKILSFRVCTYDSASETVSNRSDEYVLCGDGRIVTLQNPGVVDTDVMFPGMWADSLYCYRYRVSNSAFDTAAIAAFVSELISG